MKKLLLILLLPSVCYGIGTIDMKLGTGGGTVTVAAGEVSTGGGTGTVTDVTAGTNLTGGGSGPSVTLNLADPITISSGTISTLNVTSVKFSNGSVQVSSPSSGVAIGGSPSNVQFNSTGTLGGNNGFQYDSSVSSITLGGRFGITDNSNFIGLGDGGTDPVITVDDENGSPGGGLKFYSLGVLQSSWLNGTTAFDLSVTTNSTPVSRVSFPKNNQKVILKDAASVAKIEFDMVGNSSFTIPIYLSSITITNQVTDSAGNVGSINDSFVKTTTGPKWQTPVVDVSSVTFITQVVKTDKYGAASGLCAIYTGCIPASQYSTSISSTNYVAATFRTGATSYWQLNAPINDTYVNGSTITVNVIWTSTVTSGNVVWNFQALTTTDTLTMDGTYSSVVSVTDAANLNQSLNKSPDSGAITPNGPNLRGGQLLLKMYRGVSVSDTMSGDARLLWVEVSYNVNRFSTR